MEDEVKEVLFVNHLTMVQEAHEGKRCQDAQLESSTRGVGSQYAGLHVRFSIIRNKNDIGVLRSRDYDR